FRHHEAGLQRLGLVDSNGQPTWFTNGRPDELKLLRILGQNINSVPLSERASIERQIFGAQGAGAFSVLTDQRILSQLPSMRTDMENFHGAGPEFWQQEAEHSDL